MREVYVGGMSNVLAVLPGGGRFVYISSTSVYGQTDGGWVDETSPTEPTEEAGPFVLEAEHLLRQRRPDAIILRFAGLYGPHRLLRKQAVSMGEPLAGDADKWLNLVHVEDGADAVVAAGEKARGSTYTIADDAPTPRRAFYTLLAELLRRPPAVFEAKPEPGQQAAACRTGGRRPSSAGRRDSQFPRGALLPWRRRSNRRTWFWERGGPHPRSIESTGGISVGADAGEEVIREPIARKRLVTTLPRKL